MPIVIGNNRIASGEEIAKGKWAARYSSPGRTSSRITCPLIGAVQLRLCSMRVVAVGQQHVARRRLRHILDGDVLVVGDPIAIQARIDEAFYRPVVVAGTDRDGIRYVADADGLVTQVVGQPTARPIASLAPAVVILAITASNPA